MAFTNTHAQGSSMTSSTPEPEQGARGVLRYFLPMVTPRRFGVGAFSEAMQEAQKRRDIKEANAAREEAYEALGRVVWRRNKQDTKRRQSAMYNATHAALAAEVR